MMLRVFLWASCLLAVAFADDAFDHVFDHYGCCSREDRREILHLWQDVWESSFTERKVQIAQQVFDEIFQRFPESLGLFDRVKGGEQESPEWRAHILRITEGLDNIINLFDDSQVLFAEVKHLHDQHAARDGMKGAYILAIVDAFDHVLPQIAPCFNIDAWHRCFDKVAHMMAEGLP